MNTKAAIQLKQGDPLIVAELEVPDPRPDQVIVKLYSSGICHSQLHHMHDPQFTRPLVLGHEATGVVTHIGQNVKHVDEGDLAIVTWVPRRPVQGRPTWPPLGPTYQGQPVDGSIVYTWCEDALVNSEMVIKIDNDTPRDVSCIVGCAVLTGAGAIKNTACVRPGESVAVFGAGGVGLCAIQMASLLEAYPIVAVDLSDEKLKFAKEFGATHVVNASKEDPVDAIQSITGGGADYALDAIGVRVASEQILPSTRGGGVGADNIGGTAILIGMPSGDPNMNLDRGHFMFHQRQYRGSLGATYPEKDFELFLRWHSEGKFPLDKLITRRYRLDDINDACDALQAGEIAGRAIIEY